MCFTGKPYFVCVFNSCSLDGQTDFKDKELLLLSWLWTFLKKYVGLYWKTLKTKSRYVIKDGLSFAGS
jgi:hypothetical protein